MFYDSATIFGNAEIDIFNSAGYQTAFIYTGIFQGVVIRRQGAGLRETFTIRKVSFGIGVERTYPVNSPALDRIEVVTRGDVRRAKLYYLRDLRGKAAKIKEKRERPAS